VKKNQLNRLELKKTDRFGFGFIGLKPKKQNRTKTKKNRKKKTELTRKKPSQTQKTKPNRKQTEPNRFLF
jgi:hypothetical protein